MDRRGGGPRGGGGGGGGRGGYGGGGGRPSLDAMDYDEIPADLQEDDDNPDAGGAPDITDESGVDSETGALADQDPLEAAIDDLEGRAISALDEFKLHGGTRSSSAPGGPTLHEELAQILRPVLEVSAHVGPALARSHAPYRPNGVDQTVDEMVRFDFVVCYFKAWRGSLAAAILCFLLRGICLCGGAHIFIMKQIACTQVYMRCYLGMGSFSHSNL